MRKLLSILALGALFVVGGAPAAIASQATEIVIEDTAGALDTNTLLPAIEKIEFNEPTKVVVYTRSGNSSENLNEEVLRFARQKHPEWLSPDKQKWADSLFIFALDSTGRQVGTYFGEDRKVSPGQRDDIQNATKDLFKEAQWTDGSIAGVERAAQLMNRPWYKSPKLYAWGIAVFVIGGGILGSKLYIRKIYKGRSEKALKIGNASYSNVSLDLEATELNAKTINGHSRYGSLVLEKYRRFMSDYNELAEQGNKANDMNPKLHKRVKTALFMEEYAAKATEMDRLDDVIADTNMLLNMGSGWASAWERQLAPLQEDLREIDRLVTGKHAVPEAPAAIALTRFKTMTAAEMERWGAALESGELDPEDALDKIVRAREELTGLLKEYSEAVIAKFAKDKDEEQLMRAAMHRPVTSNPSYSSNHSIVGSVYPSNSFWSVVGFSVGYRSGRSSVQESRSASSSTGGSTGYGSSGGSFSGSGSSSSF